MNLRQPFEQFIARKLRQLPAPDADASWQQMKRLLDEDGDRGAGGKRPPGNGQWWRIGMIAFVLLCSAWLFVEKSGKPNLAVAKNNPSASPQAGANNNSNHSDNRQTSTIDKNTTLPVSQENNNNNTASVAAATGKTIPQQNTGAVVAVKENSSIAASGTNAAPVTSDTKNSGALTITTASGSKNSLNKKRAVLNTAPAAENNMPEESATVSVTRSTTNILSADRKKNTPQFSLAPAGHQHNSAKLPASKPGAGTINNNEGIAAAAGDEAVATRKNNKASGLKTTPSKLTGRGRSGKNNSYTTQDNNSELIAANQLVSTRNKTWFERLTALKTDPAPSPSFDAALAAGDSMASERETSQLLNTETKKAIARAQRDKAFEAADRKERKQLHLNLSNLFKPFSLHLDTDPWWAAGLSLNSGVSLNAQNQFNYNVNAKKGVLLDYIPSPYLQFHLNNYVYVQTELNLITPQYTPQLLIYRNNSDITAQSGMSQQKSIYIQKMYYFNWPVSLHYSPISNLYFSGGLQFSSFQSGLASIEEKQYNTLAGVDHPTNTYTNTLKFKDDSIAAKIAPNEWRWQVGAEYYWNRFSVGLRYNQSFKNAINTTVSSALPPTVSRNQSMFLFIRYNLFESRRQQTIPKNQ